MPTAPPLLERYRDLLAEPDERFDVTLGEGGTPLIHARRLGEEMGLERLFLKVEGTNPTGSFKDRGMVLAVNRAVAGGARLAMAASLDPGTFWDEARRYGITAVAYTWAQLRALAQTPGQEITFTCVPPGSGERAALGWRRRWAGERPLAARRAEGVRCRSPGRVEPGSRPGSSVRHRGSRR